MKYIIYTDVLFFINYAADILLLNGLRIILKLKTNYKRLLLGSLPGALWGILSIYMPKMSFILRIIITYIIIDILMIIISYGFMEIKELIKTTVVLYILTFTAAGIIYIFRPYIRSINICFLFLCIACSCKALSLTWHYMGQNSVSKQHIYKVEVAYKGIKKSLKGFLDTGNHLSEPESGKPVHIISASAASELCKTLSEVVFIPYRSIGKKNGVLPGIYLDYLDIEFSGKKIHIEKPLMAVSREAVSQNNDFEILLNASCEIYF